MKFEFKRERKGGAQTAKLRVNGTDLHFNNDASALDLDEGTEHTIEWLLIGPTGAALKVTMTASGVEQTLVDAKLKHEHGSQLSGSRTFRAKGGVS